MSIKRYGIAIVLIVSLLFLAACRPSLQAVSEEDAVTFTDDLGQTLTLAQKPSRVAALLGSFAQVWQLAGGEVIATADDAWDDLGLVLPENTANLGNTKRLNLELLLTAQPDFILASTNTRQNMEWQEILESMQVPVAYFDIDDFEDYLRLLDVCTEITGRKDLYETYGVRVQEQIDAVIAQSQERVAQKGAPKVLCMVASASAVYAKNSEGNVLGAMLKTLGCVNIADSEKLLLENLSLEHILVSNPDYIFFVQRGDDTEGMKAYVKELLMENPAWSQLTAVKNDRVYFMEKNLFNLKPNHRWGEAYEIMEEILRDE
jgi:iron complex transport system substrate-binding protein